MPGRAAVARRPEDELRLRGVGVDGRCDVAGAEARLVVPSSQAIQPLSYGTSSAFASVACAAETGALQWVPSLEVVTGSASTLSLNARPDASQRL